ncbi:MAG: HAMP domain-containing protein [Bacillota bacterium]
MRIKNDLPAINRVKVILYQKASIRGKIMGITLFLVLLLGLSLTWQVRITSLDTLQQQLEVEGASLARDVAARSIDYIFTNNVYALFALAKDTMANNNGVRYLFILDTEGEVLVQTFQKGIPEGLRQINPVKAEQRYNIKILETEEGLIHDVAVPIFEGRAGVVRLGMSEENLRFSVNKVSKKLLTTTFLVSLLGILASYGLATLIARPISQMVQATRDIARGNLNRRVTIRWEDEIGELGKSFNGMVENLEVSREAIEQFNREMVSRNQQLLAFNAVAVAVNQTINKDEMLQAVVGKILETTRYTYGGIHLWDDEREKLNYFYLIGNPPLEVGKTTDIIEEVALLVTKTGEPFISPDLIQELSQDHELEGQGIQVIAIPLWANNKVNGVMTFFGQFDAKLTDEDRQFIITICNYMRVATENAVLWQELKEKEEMRVYLLEKVITAQEEERKRISRELHDQAGQSLTSLILGLKVLSGATSWSEVQLRVEELRNLAYNTLTEIHDLAIELRPAVLDDLGLEAALYRYASEYSQRTGIVVDFQANGLNDLRMKPDVETSIYRTVQEALTNVAKHAQAKNVSVILECFTSYLLVIVEDDGLGFEVSEVMHSSIKYNRLGLFGMQERMALIGGTLAIESTPGVGTTVYIKVPLDPMLQAQAG